MDNQFRFGVFLRPDPKTCAAVTQITSQLRAQYGLVSAGAFPPHITLAGSLPVVVPLAELIQLIGFVLRRRPGFPVQNLGIRRLADAAIAYDVSALDGAPTGRSMILLAQLIRSSDRCSARAAVCLPTCTSRTAGCPTFRWSHTSCGSEPICGKKLRLRERLGAIPPASFTADT